MWVDSLLSLQYKVFLSNCIRFFLVIMHHVSMLVNGVFSFRDTGRLDNLSIYCKEKLDVEHSQKCNCLPLGTDTLHRSFTSVLNACSDGMDWITTKIQFVVLATSVRK